MKNKKLVISTMLLLFMIFSTAGTVFGAAGATISVAFDKENVEVGENVTLTVIIRNTGDIDLTNITVLAPLPEGLKFWMSQTGTSKNIYDPDTGIWDVGNLRLTSKGGGAKTLTITAEVLPSLKGKEASTFARFISVGYGEPSISILDQVTPASSKLLTVKGNEIVINNTKNSTDISNNSNTTNTDKNTILAKTIKNATKSQGGIKAMQNLNQPGQKTAYEVSNVNSPGTSDDPKTIYALLGGLIIAVLIVIGYFKGVKG